MVPDLQSGFPPLRSLQADRHNLPLQTTPLIGRADEIAQLTLAMVYAIALLKKFCKCLIKSEV